MLLNTNYSFFNLKNINIDDLLIFLVFYVTLESCLEKKQPIWIYQLGLLETMMEFTILLFIIFWHLIDN